MPAAKTAVQPVTMTLKLDKPGKKAASRYAATEAGAPATNIYFNMEFLESIGNPDTLTVTVAPAS